MAIKENSSFNYGGSNRNDEQLSGSGNDSISGHAARTQLYTTCPELVANLQQDTEKLLLQEQSQIPDQASDRHSRKKLVAHWEIENGKLICKWLVNDEL